MNFASIIGNSIFFLWGLLIPLVLLPNLLNRIKPGGWLPPPRWIFRASIIFTIAMLVTGLGAERFAVEPWYGIAGLVSGLGIALAIDLVFRFRRRLGQS